jgi:hypothetical protein
MRYVLPALLFALVSTAWCEDTATANLQAALGGTDAVAKKTAIRAVASRSTGSDDQVLPLLVGAITDRQAGEAAVSALSSRTGASPTGGSYAPGVDPSRIQGAWQKWYDDWKKAQDIKKLKKKDEKTTPDPLKQLPNPTDAPKTSEEKTVTPAPAEDLGKLDRVLFKAGGSLLCYVQSKRTDADGNLLSVRVVHPDGSGEETIAADLISRIEEDIR